MHVNWRTLSTGFCGKEKAGEIRRGSLNHSSDNYSIQSTMTIRRWWAYIVSEGGFHGVVDALSDRTASPHDGFLCLGDGGLQQTLGAV